MEYLVHCFGLSFILGLLIIYLFRSREKTKSVCIVVLGDIGRSPRMQYHASSFLRAGYYVEIIGYPGSLPLEELQNNPNLNIFYLRPPPILKNRLSTMVAYSIKVIYQSMNLLYILFTKCRASLLILQNPPAIPSIPICWFYCLVVRIEWVIDWHNYAHTIMALALGRKSFIVKLAALIEFYFGTRSHYNFCVSKAMQEDLEKNWNIKATVFYDRPKDQFHPISLEQKHELLRSLSIEYKVLRGADENSTLFTTLSENGDVKLCNNRPGLIISSTSWTEDEDFSILLRALDDYENKKNTDENAQLPELVCIITGKGALKEFYMAIIKEREWKHIKMITPWLEYDDYPKLLACADLGICLHTSSSNLDLPMKVIDMFGCGLPACVYNFKCINELVHHDENSLIFSNSEELSNQLQTIFKNFPTNEEQQHRIEKFKNSLTEFHQLKWHDNWMNVILPTISHR